MKKTTFQSFTAFVSMVVLSAALGTAPMRAQIAGGGGGRSTAEQQAQLDALAKAVGLTPDQVAQVRAIDADASSRMASVRSATAPASTATALRTPSDPHLSLHLTP